MTSGGHTMTEGWNLQLQGRVRELEADLAEAERHIAAVTGDMKSSVRWTLATGFLKKMAAKRALRAEVAKDMADLLEQAGASEGRQPEPSPASTSLTEATDRVIEAGAIAGYLFTRQQAEGIARAALSQDAEDMATR